MAERWVDEKAINLYWESRFEGTVPGIQRRFRYSDIPAVLDDIVRIREDQGGYSLDSTNIPIELSGAEGPVTISAGFETIGSGTGYMVEMGFHDKEDTPVGRERWDIIEDFKVPGKRRVPVAFFQGSQLSGSVATQKLVDNPWMSLGRTGLTPIDIENWVGYVWQAHLDTPPDF
jgi:hypothetical protein